MPKRSRAALRLTAAAATGRFELQQCARCGAVQYPPRQGCHRCLSVDLRWTAQKGVGQLIAETTLFHSHLQTFRRHLPWRVGLVRLPSGPAVVAHVHRSVATAPADVELVPRLDEWGYAVLIARACGEAAMNDDARFQQMSRDPRGLNIFVTDATNEVGHALVESLRDAGAARIWAGRPTEIAVTDLGADGVVCDVRSSESITRAAARIASELDMLINTSRYEGDGREEMEINYFGLLRLEQAFAAAMQSRSATTGRGTAWVNILALTALCGVASQPTFSASMAAALSVSQGLRARTRASGLRVINVLPGPISVDALARSVVSGLREGLEDIYPGELAQEWLSWWLESPKALERMVAG